MSKKILFVVLILMFSLANVSAITASIGNSRMILRPNAGEEIERYVLVKNVNDVDVTVDIFPSGDLEDNVELMDKQFVLAPGDEKKAYFTIFSDRKGTLETKINVRFTPEDGTGVGLSSTVILIVNDDTVEGGGEEDKFEELSGEDGKIEEGEGRGGEFNFNPSGIPEEEKFSSVQLLSISSVVLILAFVLLLVYATKASKKKKVGRGHA